MNCKFIVNGAENIEKAEKTPKNGVNMTIECSGWKSSSCDDGPGIRSVLFLQGCSKNCPGCQNAVTHTRGKGSASSILELFSFIEKNCRNKKITISGGEPLEQLDALMKLLKELGRNDYDICVYTGWEFKSVPKEILESVRYIKCGSFVSALRDSELMYVGSQNQKMYCNEGNGVFTEMPLLARRIA